MANLIKQTTIDDRVFGKHERDIRALKLRMLGTDGIKFDYENESHGAAVGLGGRLDVLTVTDALEADGGINFVDRNDAWGGGDSLTTQLLIDSITQGVQILQTTTSTNRPTGGLDVDVIGAIDLISEERAIVILANGNPNGLVDIEAYKSIDLFASNGPVRIQGSTLVRLTWNTGGKLEVKNGANAMVFRIDDDGSLHGLTGKSLVFDL